MDHSVGAGGTPLLCLHGGSGFTHFYLEALESLADRRQVIFYDQLGCGNSDRPDDLSLWTVDRFVEELITVRHRIQHHEHQIVFRQPLAHIHRQQRRLITLREKELLRHTPGSQAPRPAQRRRVVYAPG